MQGNLRHGNSGQSNLREKRKRRYQIGIIIRDRAFTPRDWDDAPRSAVLLEHGANCRSLAEAESWVFGYNTAALAGPGGRWAIILERGIHAAPGDTCEQTCARFRVASRKPRPAVA